MKPSAWARVGLSDQEGRGRVDALADELARVARAHVDALPGMAAGSVALEAMILATAIALVEFNVGLTGLAPNPDALEHAIRTAPWDATIRIAIARRQAS